MSKNGLKKSFLQRPDAGPDAASDVVLLHHRVRSCVHQRIRSFLKFFFKTSNRTLHRMRPCRPPRPVPVTTTASSHPSQFSGQIKTGRYQRPIMDNQTRSVISGAYWNVTGRCLHHVRSFDHRVWSSRIKQISPFFNHTVGSRFRFFRHRRSHRFRRDPKRRRAIVAAAAPLPPQLPRPHLRHSRFRVLAPVPAPPPPQPRSAPAPACSSPELRHCSSVARGLHRAPASLGTLCRAHSSKTIARFTSPKIARLSKTLTLDRKVHHNPNPRSLGFHL
jgi:hypothetical protein